MLPYTNIAFLNEGYGAIHYLRLPPPHIDTLGLHLKLIPI